MKRAVHLAKLSAGNVGTNPNVGAVLVFENKIIGEGYYEVFGGKHAEVNAVESVGKEMKHLIAKSTLYVSLEPCNFYGKTPPCSELILKHKIKDLVVGCVDPNPKIAGSSLKFLAENGVQITKSILKESCERLIQPFRTNIIENRPYVTIKFAQSKDFYISKKDQQTWLSNEYSKVYSHKLRAENNAILIGTSTAVIDNPSLTNRLYKGSSPLRVVLDRSNRIPDATHLLSDDNHTLIISESLRNLANKKKEQWVLSFDENLISSLLEQLYIKKDIGRLLVEGGSQTINSFLKPNLWDEAIVINTRQNLIDGVKAPNVQGRLIKGWQLGDDMIQKIERLA